MATTLRVPPGPTGLPLVGVFLRARRDPLRFFEDSARRHGDVVSMRLGRHHVYLLRHPDHVKHVLQDRAHAYAKGPPAARVSALFGESLTVVDGDRWRARRRQLQPVLQPGHATQLAGVVRRAIGEMLERWRALADAGGVLDMVAEMRRLTQAIIIRACFGEVRPAEIERLGEALDQAVGHVERRLWNTLGWLDAPTRSGLRYRRALTSIDAFVSEKVSEAYRSAPSPATLLGALRQSPGAPGGEPLSAAELHDELKAILVAGHTTTASALAWTWYVLSQHPDARDRLEAECRGAAGDLSGADAMSRLGHTRRVIDEVLRLYPPTWLTARTPVEDDIVDGYTIPAGSLVLLSPYLTHRHPDVWPRPERFDPDRFTPARAATRPPFAHFPFGGGPRRCVGSAFATVEMQLVVAAVAGSCRLTLLPGARVVPAAGLTLRPSPAVPLRVHRVS